MSNSRWVVFAFVFGCGGGGGSSGADAADDGSADAPTEAQGDGTNAACEAQDARGQGDCEAIIGASWDGDECVSLSGCNCIGEDCDLIYGSEEECEISRAECLGLSTCGGPGEVQCGDDEYCDKPNAIVDGVGTGCGEPGAEGVCRARPTDCTGEPSSPNCGCDGTFYATYCAANAAGYDVAYASSDGSCP